MSDAYPSFSVIVPTRARPRQLAACLDALAALDYPRERYDVIVVDDGSPKPPRQAVDALGGRLPVRLLEQSNRGPATARNRGAAASAADYLAFTDDDCRPAPDWLSVFARRFAAGPEVLYGGHTENSLKDNVYAETSQLLIDYLYAHYVDAGGQPRFAPTSNFAVRRDLFLRTGAFDERFPLAAGEDREFCDRWRGLGYAIRYEPEAKVFHDHRMGAREFLRQHFFYGRGAYHYWRAHAHRNAGGLRVEPASFYQRMISFPFTVSAGHPNRVGLATLLVLSQFANAAGFFRERLRR